MVNWKCDNCGHTFESDADKLPEKCPSCQQKCTFLNITCYTPECQIPQGTGIDPRIGKKN